MISHVQLLATPWAIAHQGYSPVHEISQARILEWTAISSSTESYWPRDRTWDWSLLYWQVVSLPLHHLGNPYACESVLVTQLCLTFCDPIDCSQPNSSVHRISQARILEWVAIPFSRVSSPPRDQIHVSCIADRFFTNWAAREALPSKCLMDSGEKISWSGNRILHKEVGSGPHPCNIVLGFSRSFK